MKVLCGVRRHLIFNGVSPASVASIDTWPLISSSMAHVGPRRARVLSFKPRYFAHQIFHDTPAHRRIGSEGQFRNGLAERRDDLIYVNGVLLAAKRSRFR